MDICDEGSDNLTKKLTNCEVFEICTEVTKQGDFILYNSSKN